MLGAHLPARPGRVVLGWLAQGYAQRHRLRNPAGLVFRRLEQGKMPVRCYLEAPEKYLPREYLAAIGRASEEAGEAAEDEADFEEEEEAPEEEAVDASLLCEVNGRTVLGAWEQAVRALQGELSAGNAQVFLREARPWTWEAGEGRLVVRAASGYARDWMAARLGRTLERKLGGILDRAVRVRFEGEG